MKRSTVAPVGMALLFLSLATVPFSLTGWSPSLSSRLDSVTNAWGQIAGVFLTVYQPSQAAQLLALEYSDKDEDPSQWDCEAQPVVALNSGDMSDGTDDQPVSDSFRQDLPWIPAEIRVNDVPVKRAKAVASVATKRSRATSSSTKSAAASPINVQRIDLSYVMKLALQSERVTKLIDRHLGDHRIQTSFDLSKLTTPGAIPARPAFIVKRGTYVCDEPSEAEPSPKKELREPKRRNRIPAPAGVGVQS